MTLLKRNIIFFTAVFIAFFIYFIWIYQPRLLTHNFQPAFYLDAHFLSRFLLYPGGLADALSLFIFQFMSRDTAGAFVLSSILTLTAATVFSILHRQHWEQAPWLTALIPSSLLLLLFGEYNAPLAIAIKFMLVLLLCVGFIGEKSRIHLLYLALSPLLYFFLGGWFYLYFILLALLGTVFIRKSISAVLLPALLGILYLLFAVISSRFLYQIPWREALFYMIPYEFYYEPILFQPGLAFYGCCASIPILLLLQPLGAVIARKRRKISQIEGRTSRFAIVDGALAAIILLLAMAAAINPEQKRKIHIDELAALGKWNEVLTEAKKLPHYDRLVEFQRNRALYFRGCLLDSLFNFDHPVGVNGLFIDREMANQIALPASDLYFDLGHINAAQVMAYEYQSKFRYNPRIIKRLVLTNIINGQYGAAEKFLRLLEKSLINKSWAVKYAELLAKKNGHDSSTLDEKRQLRPTNDFFIHSRNPSSDMLRLLERNSHNKMAFEYLMASYLLECKLGNIAQHVNQYRQFGYPGLARHIEEAAIMYQSGVKSIGGEPIQDVPFRRDRIAAFARFNRIILDNRTDKKKTDQLLRVEFGDTFWYYLYSGGGKRTDALKSVKIEENYY